MKAIKKIGMLLALGTTLFLSSCAGAYYAEEEPAEPVYVRPVAPYAGAVWIDGDWGWRGGRYVYSRGYWTRPHYGRTYMRGNWERRGRGYTWHRGYWR